MPHEARLGRLEVRLALLLLPPQFCLAFGEGECDAPRELEVAHLTLLGSSLGRCETSFGVELTEAALGGEGDENGRRLGVGDAGHCTRGVCRKAVLAVSGAPKMERPPGEG